MQGGKTNEKVIPSQISSPVICQLLMKATQLGQLSVGCNCSEASC